MQTGKPDVKEVAEKVRTAIDRASSLLHEDRTKPKRERHDISLIVQQLRGVLVGELQTIGIFPEDAYEMLYRHSTETEDETYLEELMYLEHCLQ